MVSVGVVGAGLGGLSAASPAPNDQTRHLHQRRTSFIGGWNERCHPFTQTEPVEEIISDANERAIREALLITLDCTVSGIRSIFIGA
jgi:hypothetical protein